MKLSCPNCGADCDAALPRCPYCGTLMAEGAEREYMEKLHDLREDMAALGHVPGKAVKSQLRQQGKRLRRVALVVLLAAAALALLFFWQERRWQRDHTADYIWQHENYPYMTELYERGDFEALRDFIFTAMDEDKPVWDWEYSDEFWERLEAEP